MIIIREPNGSEKCHCYHLAISRINRTLVILKYNTKYLSVISLIKYKQFIEYFIYIEILNSNPDRVLKIHVLKICGKSTPDFINDFILLCNTGKEKHFQYCISHFYLDLNAKSSDNCATCFTSWNLRHTIHIIIYSSTEFIS